MMGAQERDLNTHFARGTLGSSFTPVTAFNRATTKSFRSTIRGRWGAMHVCIAWKIYYHKQLKKVQQNLDGLHCEMTPEHPAAGLSDSVQHQEQHQHSYIYPYLDFPRGLSVYGTSGDRSETGEIPADISHSSSYLHTPSPASFHRRATRREKPDRPSDRHWEEKPDEKHGSYQTDTTKDLPAADQSRYPKVILGRKRQLESDSFVEVKRMKRDVVDSHFGPFVSARAHPSRNVRVHHMNTSDLSVLYPDSSRCTVSCPGDEALPRRTALWEPMWDTQKKTDLHFGQNVLKDYSVDTCRAVRIPVIAERQKDAFHGFYSPPLYCPVDASQQDCVYRRRRETLTLREVSSPLQMSTLCPGLLAASYHLIPP